MCQERPRPVPALALIPKGKKPQHQSSFPKSRRLSAKEALEIYSINLAQQRANCDPRNRISAVSVARKYGVTEKTVRDIWCGRSWRQETASLSELIPADECVTFLRPRGRPRKADKIFDLDEASSQQGFDFDDEVSSQVQESASCADLEWDEYTYLAGLQADAEFSFIGSDSSPSSSSEQEPDSSSPSSGEDCPIITYNEHYQRTLDCSVPAAAPAPAACASYLNAGDCVERHLWHLEQDARHDTWNLHHLAAAAPPCVGCSVGELPVCSGGASDQDPFESDWNPPAVADSVPSSPGSPFSPLPLAVEA